MPESAIAVVERLAELFNRDLGQGREPGEDFRALYVDEPVIVPFRAALEGTEYRGPKAVDDFVAATRESWSRIRVEPSEMRLLDREHVLAIGDLIGFGRETGAETRAHVAWLLVIRDGRIAEARTYHSEQEAMEALR